MRNFYDRSVPTRNLVTTLTGIITAVVTVLVLVGVLTPEQSGALSSNAVSIVEAVGVIWGAVASIILMFKATDG